MVKKILILASFILFTYSLFSYVRGVSSPLCSVCGDTSLRCLLSSGWNAGMAHSDEEWYGFNCGEDSFNQLKILSTAGGDYSLCKIEDQEPRQCPTSDNICVAEGEVLDFYQSSDETYWILARRNSGDPGFEIHLHCLSGPLPTSTSSTTTISLLTTTTRTYHSSYYENYSSIFWIIFLVIIIVVAVILYKFMTGKKQQLKSDF